MNLPDDDNVPRLSGKLASLDRVRISRFLPPSEQTAQDGDTVYNVKTAQDVLSAFELRPKRRPPLK